MNYYDVLFLGCSLLHSCKNIPKKKEKEVWAEWASVDKWAFYVPGGMPKVL
jgi:hypothetical protein